MADVRPGPFTLDRPAATWSDDDVRQVLNARAYLDPRHPDHLRVQAATRRWFERRFAGPIPLDATGRRVRDRPLPVRSRAVAPAGGEACEVPVRSHSRRDGEVEVAAHCRSRPA